MWGHKCPRRTLVGLFIFNYKSNLLTLTKMGKDKKKVIIHNITTLTEDVIYVISSKRLSLDCFPYQKIAVTNSFLA